MTGSQQTQVRNGMLNFPQATRRAGRKSRPNRVGGRVKNITLVIAGGINGMGNGTLTINGGTIAAKSALNVTARYPTPSADALFHVKPRAARPSQPWAGGFPVGDSLMDIFVLCPAPKPTFRWHLSFFSVSVVDPARGGMADAEDLKSFGGNSVRVRVPPSRFRPPA